MGTVPEGLLVTLIVSLSLSAKNMYAKNVLVKVGGCCRRRCCWRWSMHLAGHLPWLPSAQRCCVLAPQYTLGNTLLLPARCAAWACRSVFINLSVLTAAAPAPAAAGHAVR